MLATVLALTLTATPSPAVAVTHFRLVQVAPELGGFIEDRLAQQLGKRGFQVTAASDLEAVLGLERQRQLLGCTDDSACLAELSAALGVPFVATGRLTRLGARLELDVRVVRQSDARVVALDSRGTNDERELGALVEQAANAVADQLLPKPPPRPVSLRLWGPVVGGLVSTLLGAGLVAWAQVDYAQWTTLGTPVRTLNALEVTPFVESLNARRAGGLAAIGLGVALIAAGVVWHAVADVPVAVTVAPSNGGATFGLGGVFP